MDITSGGLYILDDSLEKIRINSTDPVILFDCPDGTGLSRKIDVYGGSSCEIYGVMYTPHTYEIHVQAHDPAVSLQIGYVLPGSAREKLNFSLHSQLSANETSTDVHILSLVADQASVELFGTVEIDSGLRRASGYILQENYFLGSQGSIHGVPSLLVHSDDVRAGHAARIEKISDEKLYYLRARGIHAPDATMMMLTSGIAKVLEGLRSYDAQLVETHTTTILKSIVS